MKIKKIDFIKHPVFTGHSVIFGDITIPSVSFLVGNNGSGKTKILDAIYHLFGDFGFIANDTEIKAHITLSSEEMIAASLTNPEINYIIKKANGGTSINAQDLAGGHIEINIQALAKVVYSTIEVNFGETKIDHVTSRNIDDSEVPKTKSSNLATEIPQLLIDISNLDDADRGRWYQEAKGKPHVGNIPDNIGTRLERFTNAFHKIYDGSKTFSAITNENNTKKILFKDSANNEVGLNDLSTGEKQIIYRVGYILKNIGTIKGGIILIDEPEISLHPLWQLKLKDFLHEIFDGYDVQIILATHSPYIFKNLDETKEACIKIDRSQPESKKVSLLFPGVGGHFEPSVNLISYLAYGIVSEVLHIELYTLLQIRERRDKITNSQGNNDGIENWLQDSAGGAIPIRVSFTRTGKTRVTEETIMTWIRNKLHHSDETARPQFTQVDLKSSIDEMIRLLQM